MRSLNVDNSTERVGTLGRNALKVSQVSYIAWLSFGNQIDVKEVKGLLQC